MEDVKLNLANAIAAKLSGAPDSAAKAELIEELSDNLYSRYLEMTENGVEPDDAFRAAMDALGDTDELVDYLNSLAPDEPLPGPEEGQSQDGAIWDDLKGLFQNIGEIVRDSVNAAMSAVDIDGIVKDAVNQAKNTVGQAKNAVKDAAGAAAGKDTDRIYGFGYDKTKGGWFAQWGEWKGSKSQAEDEPEEPWFHGEGAWMEAQPDGTCAVQGKLCAIDVDVGGDIAIRTDETENDDVVIGGDIEDITVDAGADGKLTIRQRARTASAGFLFNRGLSSADVELTLPRRRWESIQISTVNGDIEVEGDEPVGTLSVQTVSGDVNGCVGWCEQLSVRAVNGDMEWRGGADEARLESVSGDVEVEGHFGSLEVSSSSGDVEFTGDCGANHIKCSSISGDIEVESDVLPLSMDLSSKSGDIEARIPDSGPFSVHFRTTSGDISCDFFAGVIRTRRFFFGYGSDTDGVPEDAPVYYLSTVSGDVSLDRI